MKQSQFDTDKTRIRAVSVLFEPLVSISCISHKMLICLWRSVNVVWWYGTVSLSLSCVLWGRHSQRKMEISWGGLWCIYFLFFSSSMTVNIISLGCGQTKTFEDVILDFGKHWQHFFNFFWHLRDQTMNLLIKKTINRLTDNESNHKLQPYCGLHPQPWMLQIWILRHCLKIFCCCPKSISPSKHHSKKDVGWTCWQDASTCKQDQLWLFMLRISDKWRFYICKTLRKLIKLFKIC